MRRWIIAAVVVVLVACAAGVAVHRAPDRTVTARFTSATGVYPGSAVRVLGVRIGTVTAVTPDGPDVRVELTYDRRYRLPADAIAAIVSPALAGDRFVQLA
ncbi:MAG: mammalian cell entry protein, partial [Actinomycetia bacterium]|nr:mammalian cell entry protein [Actinomycetes bacterium]